MYTYICVYIYIQQKYGERMADRWLLVSESIQKPPFAVMPEAPQRALEILGTVYTLHTYLHPTSLGCKNLFFCIFAFIKLYIESSMA